MNSQARGKHVHVSKAYPYDHVLSISDIRGSIATWCGEEGVDVSQAKSYIKHVEVRPGDFPDFVLGIEVVQNSDACKNTVHIKVI